MGTEATVTQTDERSPAQFFFEMGFGACYAEAMIRDGNKAPFPLSDAEIERQWVISQEAYDDPAELGAMLARTAASQASDAGRGYNDVSIDHALRSALRFAASRSAITSKEEQAILAIFDATLPRQQRATANNAFLAGYEAGENGDGLDDALDRYLATLTAPPTSDAGEEGPTCAMCLGCRVVDGDICTRCGGVGYRSPPTSGEALTQLQAMGQEFDAGGGAVTVRKIETVTGDFMTEPGEPFWRIEIDGYCADFDYEEAANNFAAAINGLCVPTSGEEMRLREALERIDKLTPFSANASTAEDFAATVHAITGAALTKGAE